MFQRILVVWDGSELAERAFAMGLELAGTYEAELVAASVIDPTSDDQEARLVSLFADRHAEHERRGWTIGHELIRGSHPDRDLLAYAHRHGFDLLVVGHHREPKPGVLVLHGVAEHLVAAADVPVLVVGG